jgi:uncharacterized protein DUF3592
MATVVGVWFALAGVLPVLAGLSGRHRARRLRRGGVKAWAVAVPWPLADDEGPRQIALQYTLADGRVLEKLASAGAGKPLRPGQSVLVWYDPADPQDILVYGHEGRWSDLMFVAAGAAFMLAGAGITVFAS